VRQIAVRDERETSIDQAADRLSYLVMSFGLLVLVAYRSLALGSASWDLMGLVVLGGVVGALYRVSRRAITRQWAVVAASTAGVALVVAVVIVLATRG
jgi:hypothetical protein